MCFAKQNLLNKQSPFGHVQQLNSWTVQNSTGPIAAHVSGDCVAKIERLQNNDQTYIMTMY